MRELSGKLTRTAAYRGTICDVEAIAYLIAKINEEDLPVVAEAKAAKTATLAAIQKLITDLAWQDFEILVDLIFAQSGWRRIGQTGATQKTVDIELELPSTGEHAFVQVKSQTQQAELESYIDELDGRPEGRMFFAYHSATSHLNSDDLRVTLLGPELLSEMALDTGLFTWLIQKAG